MPYRTFPKRYVDAWVAECGRLIRHGYAAVLQWQGIALYETGAYMRAAHCFLFAYKTARRDWIYRFGCLVQYCAFVDKAIESIVTHGQWCCVSGLPHFVEWMDYSIGALESIVSRSAESGLDRAYAAYHLACLWMLQGNREASIRSFRFVRRQCWMATVADRRVKVYLRRTMTDEVRSAQHFYRTLEDIVRDVMHHFDMAEWREGDGESDVQPEDSVWMTTWEEVWWAADLAHLDDSIWWA